MFRVILFIDCASEFDRRLLRGMMRYSRENGPWLFYRMPSDFLWEQDKEKWVLEWARKWKADAIIGRWDEAKVNLLSRLDIPIVLQNNRTRSDVYSNLTGDYEATGRLAAGYFRKKLFTNYAFYGVKNIIWSEERCRGFREEVEKSNGRYYEYKADPYESFVREEAVRWIESLPKPVALFCCDDAHALLITEACRMSGIDIPGDVLLLGVDNDELLCGISDPPISSIELDVEHGGYMTCKLLHEMVQGKVRGPFNVIVNPVGIIERESTLRYNISDQVIEKIVKYIDDSYSTDFQLRELFETVPLSRRSVEMRFRKAMGITVYQYIIMKRVEHMAHLLVTTDRPVADIAYEAGFRDCFNIARVFRKYKGCSPVEYRHNNCVF
ncbi:MAG: DNA-binding transcriptional regulator [Bacteroidales bacterium]|nr:DNA-binding transcriptional regulator [Bacteroidales bacterium]